jgi:hypothetical protein
MSRYSYIKLRATCLEVREYSLTEMRAAVEYSGPTKRSGLGRPKTVRTVPEMGFLDQQNGPVFG